MTLTEMARSDWPAPLFRVLVTIAVVSVRSHILLSEKKRKVEKGEKRKIQRQ